MKEHRQTPAITTVVSRVLRHGPPLMTTVMVDSRWVVCAAKQVKKVIRRNQATTISTLDRDLFSIIPV
uniref:Uncharacterized protein n=1 Tax=Helianthus annuus TaxID=4232 RepID=A0A251VQR0_HELAN